MKLGSSAIASAPRRSATARSTQGQFKASALLFALALLLPAAGCAPQGGLQPATPEQWPQMLAAHRGSPLVVFAWASWCRNCIELFPDIASLHRKHRGAGVAFLSVCLDDSTDPADVAGAKLAVKNAQASFAHYHLEQDLGESLEQLGLGNIPAVLVFGPDGQLRYHL